jgi:lauroyl/myristoyl acyltransferase
LLAHKLRQMGYRAGCVIGRAGVPRLTPANRLLLPRLCRETHDERLAFLTGGSFAKALAHLRRGGLVVLLGDGRVRAERPLPFLGATWGFADGPYEIAAAADVPIVTALLRRLGDGALRLDLDAFPEVHGVAEAAACFAGVLDAWGREAPERWWRLWPTFLEDASVARAPVDP